jgi:hypothetical protein
MQLLKVVCAGDNSIREEDDDEETEMTEAGNSPKLTR